MATFVLDLVNTLADRWREVDVLLKKAQEEESNPDCSLHDVLCRASVVLVVAHLEGFVRDCARAVLHDINRFSNFQASPSHLKRTFCSTFVQVRDGSDNKKIAKLIALLDGLQTKFAPEPFLFEGKNDDSRNPSPAVVERIARNFGIGKFFSLMASSKTDEVFKNNPSDIAAITDALRDHLLAHTADFPYTVDPRAFDLDVVGVVAKGTRTLWETFLDNLLKKRHDIAHGSDRLNGTSVSEINRAKSKVVVLQYAFALTLCKHAV